MGQVKNIDIELHGIGKLLHDATIKEYEQFNKKYPNFLTLEEFFSNVIGYSGIDIKMRIEK